MAYPTIMPKFFAYLILLYQMTEINFILIGKLVHTRQMNFKLA